MRRLLDYFRYGTLAFFLALPAFAAQPADFSALTKAVDQTVDKSIREGRVTGSVILVYQDGKPVYRRAAGFADPDKKLPMQESAIFRLSSVSKAYTSMAAAALIQQGKLKLDDPVTKWLPDFRPKTKDGKTPVVTVRHLMTHTAGLDYGFAQPRDGSYPSAGVSDGLDNPRITLNENIRRIGTAPLLFEPGTAWHYSLAIDVLGGVIASAGGMPLPEAMAALVTVPLGMKDTGFVVPERDRARVVAPYYMNNGKLVRMNDGDTFVPMGDSAIHFVPGRIYDAKAWPSGGAGMAGSAPDIMILLETIRKGGAPVVGGDLMKAMCSNQTGRLATLPGMAYGLGWGVLTDPAAADSPQTAGTVFWSGVYGHNWFVDPAKKLSVVIMTSTTLDSLETRGLASEVRDAIYANLPE